MRESGLSSCGVLGVHIVVAAAVLAGSANLSAQGLTADNPAVNDPPAAPAAPAAPADPQLRPTPPPPPPTPAPVATSTFTRWVDLQTANFQARYRYVETSAGVISAKQGQDSVAVKARVKFDPAGRFSVTAGVATGNGFTSGWNNMGVGTGDAVNTWYLKQFFVAAAPVKGIEFSYGGLAPVRGESTEITSWDNDGYLLGERASIKLPKDVFFDEVSLTTGYLGDVTTSAFTDRYHHLDEVNYRHFLVSKKVSKAVAASADYTWLSGVGTFRTALSARVPARVVDSVRYEQYVRGGPSSAFGFAAYGEKNVVKRVAVGGGYANIDPNYGGLNADRFNKGRRVYETATVSLTRELAASFFATQAVHNSFAVTNKTRIDAVITFNAVAALKRYGIVR
jgi:hypothetical protein